MSNCREGASGNMVNDEEPIRNSEHMNLGHMNLGLLTAEWARGIIEKSGGTDVIIGNGNGEGCPLERAHDFIVQHNDNTLYGDEEPGYQLIIDFDGVMVHPWQTLMSVWREGVSRLGVRQANELIDRLLNLNAKVQDGDSFGDDKSSFWKWFQTEEMVSFSTLRAFLQLVQESRNTVLWTSRINPVYEMPFGWIGKKFKNVLGKVSGWENRFPFLGDDAVCSLEQCGVNRSDRSAYVCGAEVIPESKVRVLRGKGMRSDSRGERGPNPAPIDTLYEIVDNAVGMTYYVGSSVHDRIIVIRFLNKYPNLASRLTFIDTGHLIL